MENISRNVHTCGYVHTVWRMFFFFVFDRGRPVWWSIVELYCFGTIDIVVSLLFRLQDCHICDRIKRSARLSYAFVVIYSFPARMFRLFVHSDLAVKLLTACDVLPSLTNGSILRSVNISVFRFMFRLYIVKLIIIFDVWVVSWAGQLWRQLLVLL